VLKTLGRFCTAEEAARAYDNAVRRARRRVVNFPRPGTHEVQALKGEAEELTLLRHAGKRLPPRNGPLPAAPDYKGVKVDALARTAAVFRAKIGINGGVHKFLGSFCTAEEAARAHDDAARKAGRRVVNFPRPGTDEVQAVKGERHDHTLARHNAAQQAAGGAGAIAPPGVALPPLKRRAAAPPPSEPSRKRATAANVKPKMPAAAAPEAPAAPPPARYTRRPPHRIETAASPPPEPDAPAIKTEMPPAGVKAETAAAPPMPAVAVSGCPLLAPPPPSAAAAPPPVKMERDPA
jgi:plasmid stabilization system protein ParE